MSKAACRVSVIIPVFNGEAYLGDCIESVLAQGLTDFEVFIVDDGSLDKSLEIAKHYCSIDKRIKLLFHPNHANYGVSRSRELGVSQARGRYVAFLDADDIFEKDKLEEQVALMEQHPDAVLCHTAIKVFPDQGKANADSCQKHFNKFGESVLVYRYNERSEFLKCNRISNSSTLVRTSILKNLRFSFPQAYQYEDWTLWVLLSCQGKFVYCPKQLINYRLSDSSATQRVSENPLNVIYSRLEFLFSTIVLAKDKGVIRLAKARIGEVIGNALEIYDSTNLYYPLSGETRDSEIITKTRTHSARRNLKKTVISQFDKAVRVYCRISRRARIWGRLKGLLTKN